MLASVMRTMGVACPGANVSGEQGPGGETLGRMLYNRSPDHTTPSFKVNFPLLKAGTAQDPANPGREASGTTGRAGEGPGGGNPGNRLAGG